MSSNTDLWSRVYDSFSRKNPKLDAAFREILSSEALSPKVATSSGDAATTEREMSELVRREVDRMERREWRIDFGTKSIRIRTQVDRILKILSFVKDLSTQAAGLDPVHAGLPVAGLYLILSVVSIPTMSSKP